MTNAENYEVIKSYKKTTTENKTKLSLQAEAERIKKSEVKPKESEVRKVENAEAAGSQIWKNAMQLAQPEHPTVHNNFQIYKKWVGEQ